MSDVDLVRSMALSSAELWHEILERLTQVQESQAALARAIETLGLIVRNALSGGRPSPAPAPGPAAPARPKHGTDPARPNVDPSRSAVRAEGDGRGGGCRPAAGDSPESSTAPAGRPAGTGRRRALALPSTPSR